MKWRLQPSQILLVLAYILPVAFVVAPGIFAHLVEKSPYTIQLASVDDILDILRSRTR